VRLISECAAAALMVAAAIVLAASAQEEGGGGGGRGGPPTLCRNCRSKMFIMNVGKCSKCGGETSSGAFRYCAKCARALGKCQACGRGLDNRGGEDSAHDMIRRPGEPGSEPEHGGPRPSGRRPVPKPGAAVEGLELALSSDRKSYKRGEKITLTLTFENVSRRKMRVFLPSARALGRHVNIKATGPGVQRRRDRLHAMVSGSLPMLKNYPELQPGGKTTVEITLDGWPLRVSGGDLCLAKAGTYKLTATYTYDKAEVYYFDPKPSKVPAPQVWKGVVASTEVKFSVK